jgi:hypothetical protein
MAILMSTNSIRKRVMITDDATYISSLTLDSSFPMSLRTQYPKVTTSTATVKADDSEEKPFNHSNNKKLAYMKLALRIKELQEKVRLAKMIEEVYQQSMHESSDNDQSFVIPEDDESSAMHHGSSNITTLAAPTGLAGYLRASSPPRPSRKMPVMTKQSDDNESDCWSQGTSTTLASLDADFFHQHHDVSPILEIEGEDSTSSSNVSRRSGQSVKTGTSKSSRTSAISRPCAKYVTIPLVEVDDDDLDEELPTRAGELLVGFP